MLTALTSEGVSFHAGKDMVKRLLDRDYNPWVCVLQGSKTS